MRTGKGCHPIIYFWLGYAHARGKNVIPITLSHMDDNGHEKVDDLAFDIRAQRHMVFNPRRPELLKRQLERTLHEMIEDAFAEWSRNKFWSTVLGKIGEISIFTGALHNAGLRREMIGDWDLRAVSELTSYFSQHQYKPSIETPLYSPDAPRSSDLQGQTAKDSDHLGYIRTVLDGFDISKKSCIIIASADVNPLTEIVLGSIYGVDEKALFTTTSIDTLTRDGIAVCKFRKGISEEAKKSENKKTDDGRRSDELRKTPARVFYVEQNSKGHERRGFKSIGQFLPDGLAALDYISQDDQLKETEEFYIYGHLVIARNPFAPKKSGRYVIVLNGVSGPATFALTQVLTGRGQELAQNESFDFAAESEKILSRLVEEIQKADFGAVDCILKVTIGASPHSNPSGQAIFDWRRVKKWELAKDLQFGAAGIRVVHSKPRNDSAERM